jgi:hypothetical protein
MLSQYQNIERLLGPTDDWTGRWLDIVAISIDFLARPRPLSPSDPKSDAHLEAPSPHRHRPASDPAA